MHSRSLAAAGLVVLAIGSYACHDRDLTGPNAVPAALDIVAGDGQSGAVGAELPQPLVARVLNSDGQPLAGQIVNFRVVKGDGSVFAGAAITNADGLAQERWTLGKSIADSQVVEARAVDPSSGEPLVFARFVATPIAGAPIALEKVAGDGQTAVRGSVLPDSPLVRTTDAYGNPVAGVSVAWSVVSGNGAVSRASDVTTATGYASTKWTLGNALGEQTARALVGVDLATTFTATSTSAPAISVAKNAGDNQYAAPGSAVTVPPSIKVMDSNGSPQAGAAVTFSVTSGGGTVTGATTVTNSAGIATVGSWILGSQAGINALSATVTNAGSVSFTATGAQITPDITVTIVLPESGLVGDTVNTRVNVSSRLQISSVRAALAGKTVTLTAGGSGVWTGIISLVGTPRDTMTLVVTATDANGTAAQAVQPLIYDRKPRVTVAHPLDYDVARPNTQIDATCDDDDPNGCAISARLSDGTLLVGPSPFPLHTSVSLAARDGGSAVVVITATDSKGQATSVTRTVVVESSTRLHLLGAADSLVVDQSGTRLLWVSSSRTTVGIRDFVDGTDETVATGLQGSIQRALLTPNGAALSAGIATAPYARLYLSRNGNLTTKDLNSTTSLAGSGNYLIYTQNPSAFGQLYRTDVTSGADVLIAGSVGNSENSVSENGDVAYWNSSYDIVRYHGTTSTPVTSDGSSGRQNTAPLTDGVNIVFRSNPSSQFSQMEIWLFDGSSLSLLAPARNADVGPHHDYEVNNGWTAFTKADAGSIAQVWTRSPTGTTRAVSALGSASVIRSLGADGSVIFDNGPDRYLAGPSGSPARISYSNGVVVWRDGRFVVLLGNSAFTVNP